MTTRSDGERIDEMIEKLKKVKVKLDTAMYSLDDVHVLRILAIDIGVLASEIAVACT